jgi:hypothetical protein
MYIYEHLSPKQLQWLLIASFSVPFVWFIYIFGVLGHVCPVTFLGMWHVSLFACVVFKGERPRFPGALISLVLTAGLWFLAFFYLHPFDEDNLQKTISVGPFILLILTPILDFLIHIPFISKISRLYVPIRLSSRVEIILEQILSIFSCIVCIIIPILFLFTPIGRSLSWNDDPQEWFDTLFRVGDVWRLFAFLCIIALSSGIMMLLGLVWARNKSIVAAVSGRILGYLFFGMLFIGSWGLFVYLGKIQESHPS